MSDLARNRYNKYTGGHIIPWLGAYYDGELADSLLEDIKAHLDSCAQCRSELAELDGLSKLLQSYPAAKSKIHDEEFTRRVLEQLSPPALTIWKRTLIVAWRFAPIFLFAIWAFAQAVGWISGALMLGLPLVPGASDILQGLLPLPSMAGASLLGDLLRMCLLNFGASDVIEQVTWMRPVGAVILYNLIFIGILAALFLSWLASWWAYYTRHQVIMKGSK